MPIRLRAESDNIGINSVSDKGERRAKNPKLAANRISRVHRSPWPDASLEAGEGANRLTKPAPATRGRKHDGSTRANLPAGDTPRVRWRSPVRANHTPESLRGGTGQPVSLPRHHFIFLHSS